jgi:HSP20 family protein
VPDADDSRAQASFRDGLLTVTLPKSERAREKVRRIPIDDSSATTH